MTTTRRIDRYAFDNSAPQADTQLATLEWYLDPVTTSILDQITLPAAARCLEIGAGAGSIAGYLADRVRPAGRVVAVDLDTSRLANTRGVHIHQHDIRTGLPADETFDLIHARLVLLHLPQRHQILRTLVDALAPGGWLVIGEFSHQPLRVISTPSHTHAALFNRVINALVRVLEDHGADLAWAHQVHPAMLEAGLRQVHSIEHAESWTGDGPGARLHHVNSQQKHDELIAAGLTATELVRFRHLIQDPRFCARSWQFVCTYGRKPTQPGQDDSG